MRVLPLVVALALGCAGVARPPERHYRVSGLRSTQAPVPGEEASDVLHLGGGVEYTLQATVASGIVRLRTVIRNGGREPVRYDLQRMVVAAADGGPLRLVDAEAEPTAQPTDGKRTSEGFVSRVHAVDAGRQYVIVRRYKLADGLRRGRDALLLSRLSLSDVVHVGGRETPVTLRLDEVR